MKPLTLVVNLSLRSIRVILIDDNGIKIYEDWLPVRTYINNYSVEQDPNEWWELLLQLLSKLSKKKELSKNIKFITATSSALCLVIIDKKGTVLTKSLMVSDKRAWKEAELLNEEFPDFFKSNRGFNPTAGFMIPKVLWLKNNDKQIFNKSYKFLSSNDFLIYKLTGKIVTDYLNAEKFYYLTDKITYPDSVLHYAAIDKNKLPEVVPPGTAIGSVSADIKNILGAKEIIEVAVSTYDAICALVGGNVYKNGNITNVCGTCSSYRIFTDKKEISSELNFLVQSFPSEKTKIIGGSNNLEGGLLEWGKECFYGDNYFKDDDFLYDLMQKEAQSSDIGAHGIIFLPYLLGERFPFSDPNVRGLFFGIERFHKRADFVRSLFEANGFQARLMIDEFVQHDFEISSITMSGGVAKMPFAASIRADILGIPVNVLSEIETTALGAYILTQKAAGKFKSIIDGSKLIKIKKTYLPNMHNHNAYSSLFLLYKQLYTANKDLFKKRLMITEQIGSYRKQIMESL